MICLKYLSAWEVVGSYQIDCVMILGTMEMTRKKVLCSGDKKKYGNIDVLTVVTRNGKEQPK